MLFSLQIVVQMLAATIMLLAICFAILQFFPRLLQVVEVSEARIPMASILEQKGVKKALMLLRLIITFLSASAGLMLIYIVLIAFEGKCHFMPTWLGYTLALAGVFALAAALVSLGIMAWVFKVERITAG